MFDEHARDLIDQLPKLAELDPATCRRALSKAYLMIVDARIGAERPRDDPGEGPALYDLLRRMCGALESIAVFDPLHGVEIDANVKQSSAFVAAEALSLIEELLQYPAVVEATDPLQDSRIYSLVEAALLYMIGGYDINAVAAISKLGSPIPSNAQGSARYRSGERLLQSIVALCRGDVATAQVAAPAILSEPTGGFDALVDDVRVRLYGLLRESVDEYRNWLAGKGSLEGALWAVHRARDACRLDEAVTPGLPRSSAFSDVYHLASLLASAMASTSERSVVHHVPPPMDGDEAMRNSFPDYLRARARGSAKLRGRPLLWPSTLEYVQGCLPGPHRDAVISMPTGSGKSFVAELAVVHGLMRGWVLYLAPTNALALQIRRDLAGALAPFEDVSVEAFVGGAEYSTLSDDELKMGRFVAVMTPEKCALALRLYPHMFSECTLCVFDECHLLNDEGRGALADILLAQLFQAAPSMKTLLMSAMISNATELADWLSAVRQTKALTSLVKWRPSRAARSFVFIDEDAFEAAKKEMIAERSDAVASIKVSRDIPLAWIAGLSGPWTTEGAVDYRTASLPLTVAFEVKRSRSRETKTLRDSQSFPSWKNPTGQAVAELLASRGMPTINFILSSRHHAFGRARKVAKKIPGALGDDAFPPIVEAQLAIADVELGVETELRGLLRKGVAVHTSAMLLVEQAAAEALFSSGRAKLMIATGTLAQGLNFPALAVVVSGSQLATAGPDGLFDVDAAAGLTRAKHLILNGFGRAGRPGFANQGVVVLVSDKPLSGKVSQDQAGDGVLGDYPVLGESDASVAVRSPIETFLDDLLTEGVDGRATRLEVALTAHLASFDDEHEHAGTLLRRTFAGYRKRAEFTEANAALAQLRIAEVKSQFLSEAGVPPWMPRAAMKAGVDLFRAQRMWEACQARGLVDVEQRDTMDVEAWVDVLFEVLAQMPIARVLGYLDDKKTVTPRTKLNDLSKDVVQRDVVPWVRPDGWVGAWEELALVVRKYMAGRPYTELGEALFGEARESFTSARANGASGLPPVFKFVGDVIERQLATDAGCMLALYECWTEATHPGVALPESLRALPLCIRNGCDSLEVLAWFRHGFRQRVCAHALASAYPLTATDGGEVQRSVAVARSREQWLSAEPSSPPSLLDRARVIVQEGASTSSSQR